MLSLRGSSNLLGPALQQDGQVAVAPRYDAIPVALCLSKCHASLTRFIFLTRLGQGIKKARI